MPAETLIGPLTSAVRSSSPLPFGRSRRSVLRSAAVVGGWCLVVLSCSGLTSQWVFSEPSVIKYISTVVASLLLTLAVASHRPLFCAATLIVACAPFAPFGATFFGLTVHPIYALLCVASVLLLMGTGRRLGRGYTSRTVPVCGALLVIPFGIASHGRAAFLILATGALVTWVVARVTADDGPWTLIGVFLVMCTLQSLIAIYEYQTGNSIDLYAGGAAGRGAEYFFGYAGVNRSTGTFYDPIALGNVLGAGIPLSVVVMARACTRRRYWRAAGYALVALVITSASLTTLSRMSWLGAAAGLALTVLLMPRRSQLWAVGGILLSTLLGVKYAAALAGPAFALRLSSIFHPTGIGVETAQGDELRLQVWAFARQTWEQHFITGIGFGDLPYEMRDHGIGSELSVHAHSVFFSLAAEGGLLALTALALLMIAWVRDVLSALGTERLAVAGVLGGFVVFVVGGLTDTTLLLQQSVMTACACVLGIGLGVAARVRYPGPGPGVVTGPVVRPAERSPVS